MEDFPFDISLLPKWEREILSFCEQALHSPDSAMLRVQKKLKREFEAGFPNENDFFELLARVYEWMAPRFDELRRRAAAQILADTPRARSYWKLISAANERHPGSPFVLICEQQSFGRAKIRALAALDKAKKCNGTGEQKANAALAAAAAVVEVYKVYLAKLEVLQFLANGEKHPGKSPSPGNLCKVLARRCSDPKMVEPDIVHIRNAAAHGHFEYLEKRRLRLSDAGGRWSQETTTSQVLRKAWQAFDSVCAFERALQAFVFQFYIDLLGPIVPKMARLIRGQLDAEELELINRDYQEREAVLLPNIGKFRDLCGRGEVVHPRGLQATG